MIPFSVYVLAFVVAAAGCFLSLLRTPRITDDDTRRGLTWLLALSGCWAIAHVGYLVAPSTDLQYGFYLVGLLIGFATVGPWLYFCSAYTGRRLHLVREYRLLAAGVYLVIASIKVTNPLHGYYFTAELVSTPFAYLAVHSGVFHWTVMGLAYVLAAIGYFMLFELFTKVGHDTKPLLGLIGITALPIGLDIVGFTSPQLIDMTYEPLGVAIFAVGVCFVYLDRFQAVKLTGERDDVAIFLDENGRIRDYNRSAVELFPELAETTGEQIDDVLPGLADLPTDEEPVVSHREGEETRYYRISTNPFQFGETSIGRLIAVRDVTERERYRRGLERQNERLDQFASVISHDLRNPLNVAQGRLELERENRDNENLQAIARSLDRMEELIEDVLTLARQGRDVDDLEPAKLSTVVAAAERSVQLGEASVALETDATVMADDDRIRQLLENLFRNAIEHGGEDVTITVGAIDDGTGRVTGFYVEDDGVGIPEENRDDLFEPGYTTSQDGTGFGLAIVTEVADAHGWTIDVTESENGGARFELRGVEQPESERKPKSESEPEP